MWVRILPRVKFKLYAFLREVVNSREIEVVIGPDKTLRDAIEELIRISEGKLSRYLLDKEGELRDSLMFVVEGKSLKGKEIEDFIISEDIQVAIFPPFSGGQI